MGNQIPKVFSYEIDNFSQRNTPIISPLFSSRYCNWCVTVYPKASGTSTSEHMSVYLNVPDSQSRPEFWSRDTNFRFVIVNPSNVLKSKSFEAYHLFHKKYPMRGFKMRLSKLHEKGFLVNDQLKIEVYLKVIEVRGGLDPPLLPQMVNVNGFQVLQSQVYSANWIFKTYPETALYIHPQDPQVKTAYMNILLRIFKTLYYSPLEKLTDAELINVSKGLLDLTQAGFKLEWLRQKLEKVSMERKKLNHYEAEAQELGKQLKNLEQMMCNLKTAFRPKTDY